MRAFKLEPETNRHSFQIVKLICRIQRFANILRVLLFWRMEYKEAEGTFAAVKADLYLSEELVIARFQGQ